MKKWTGVVASVAVPVLLGMATSAEAAVYVHTTTLPTELSGLNKSTTPFVYLEIERAAEQVSRILPTEDNGHTYWRTSNSTTLDGWGASDITFNGTDQSEFGGRGANTLSYSNVSTQWNNRAIPAGYFTTGSTVAVYVFTNLWSGTSRSATLSFSAGTDLTSAALETSSVGSVTINGATSGQVGWYKIGEFTYQPGVDTFILTYNTVLSATQADTVLLVQMPVPEPAGAGLLSLGCATFLLQLRKR